MSAKPPVTYITIDSEEVVNLQSNTTGSFTAIADIQIPEGYRYEFPKGEGIQMFVYTHETETASADATDETQNLDNNLVNSPALRDIPQSDGDSETEVFGPFSLVVWDDSDDHDFQTGVDAVDYSGNSFDYTESNGTESDLEVYYLWGDSSQLEFRHYDAAEEEYNKRWIGSMRQFHEARTFDHKSLVTFKDGFTMTQKEHLKLSLKTSVDLTNWDAYDENQGGGAGDMTTYSYSDFSIPVRRIPV